MPAISRGRHFYLCPPPTMALSYEDLTIVNHRYRVAEQFPPIRYKSISATVSSRRKTWRLRLVPSARCRRSARHLSSECTRAIPQRSKRGFTFGSKLFVIVELSRSYYIRGIKSTDGGVRSGIMSTAYRIAGFNGTFPSRGELIACALSTSPLHCRVQHLDLERTRERTHVMRFTVLIMARELSRFRYTHCPDKSSLAISLFRRAGSHWPRPIFVTISSVAMHATPALSPAVRRNWRNRRANGKFRIRILFIHGGSTCTSISFRSGNRVSPRQRSSGIFKATLRERK